MTTMPLLNLLPNTITDGESNMTTATVTAAAMIAEQAREAAFAAADRYFKEELGGVDRYACGFAWVNIYPEHKGNTRLGKEERQVLKEMGFREDYTKAYQLWNPSGYPCQNVDTLEAGARAAAAVFKSWGFKASAGSRLD